MILVSVFLCWTANFCVKNWILGGQSGLILNLLNCVHKTLLFCSHLSHITKLPIFFKNWVISHNAFSRKYNYKIWTWKCTNLFTEKKNDRIKETITCVTQYWSYTLLAKSTSSYLIFEKISDILRGGMYCVRTYIG